MGHRTHRVSHCRRSDAVSGADRIYVRLIFPSVSFKSLFRLHLYLPSLGLPHDTLLILHRHNRLRMITASFLAKHLLLDWRLGEQFFMLHLIDGDFASNNGGWGFSSSAGVDPQPYFRVFNPWLQSERFDEEGDFIREWVEELRDVKGRAVHGPYEAGVDIGAGVVARRNRFPRPIVEHKFARARCLERYKEGLGRSTA
jgi:deoxyribodipyrimidine photo-lyase